MLRIQVENSEAVLAIKNVQANAGNLRAFFIDFTTYMQGQTLRMFQKLGRGGAYRGVTWNKFAPQYTRKTDGVTVPAEGNVPRVRAGMSARKRNSGRQFVSGAGQDMYSRQFTGKKSTGKERTVRGRLRPSGKRVTSQSKLMQDTGQLKSAALNRVNMSDTRLVMDTSTKYAGYQNQLRPFAFFEVPRDLAVAEKILNKRLGK